MLLPTNKIKASFTMRSTSLSHPLRKMPFDFPDAGLRLALALLLLAVFIALKIQNSGNRNDLKLNVKLKEFPIRR